MSERIINSEFCFISQVIPKEPHDATTKLAIRKKAMKAAAITRRSRGKIGITNRLQYPPPSEDLSRFDVQTSGQYVEGDPNTEPTSSSTASTKQIPVLSIASDLYAESTVRLSQGTLPCTPALMAKIASKREIPRKVPAQGFELVNIKYGFEPMNVSSLTTIHIGRTTLKSFAADTSRLGMVFRFHQASYLSFLPSRYNQAQCLNDAANCLFAQVRQILSTTSDATSWAYKSAFFYGKALRSLHQAINSAMTLLAPETLCATQMMALFELLNASPEKVWIQHTDAASRLIQHRGPESFRSDFEKALLIAHANSIVTEAFLFGRSCFLETSGWQTALFNTIETDAKSADRSEMVVTLWMHLAKVPGLFAAIDQLLLGDSSKKSADRSAVMVSTTKSRLELLGWNLKWRNLLQVGSFSQENTEHLPNEECDKRREVLGTFLSCLTLENRLVSAVDQSLGAFLEEETRGAALHILDLQSQAMRKSPQGDLFMTQTVAMAQAALDTEQEWREASRKTNQFEPKNRMIPPAVYRQWSRLLGRNS